MFYFARCVRFHELAGKTYYVFTLMRILLQWPNALLVESKFCMCLVAKFASWLSCFNVQGKSSARQLVGETEIFSFFGT